MWRVEPDDSEVSDRTLVGERFVAETGIKTPSWTDMMLDLARDQTPYEVWRLRKEA